MYLPFQSNCSSFLDLQYLSFFCIDFYQICRNLEFWVFSLSFEFFHPWVFLARSKKNLLKVQAFLVSFFRLKSRSESGENQKSKFKIQFTSTSVVLLCIWWCIRMWTIRRRWLRPPQKRSVPHLEAAIPGHPLYHLYSQVQGVIACAFFQIHLCTIDLVLKLVV